jgi:outer membrane protein TolC
MRRIHGAAAFIAATGLAAFLSVVDAVSAQTQPSSPPAIETVRRLTLDEAVQGALENNLGLRAARIEPAVQDLAVAEAQAAWHPTLTSFVQADSVETPNNSFLSGAQGIETRDRRVTMDLGVTQALPWGATYDVGWNSLRATTTNIFSNFSPQLRSTIALNYTQSLLRGYSIDAARHQLLATRKERELADMALRQTVVQTARAVRRAYWDLVYAIDDLAIQRQSLELALESLRNTRARIEIGTAPPIDAVEGEAEVALREEAVIVAEALIGTAEDVLRALVFDPTDPAFWTFRIQPTSMPALPSGTVNVDAAMQTALSSRTDLLQLQGRLEEAEIEMRFLRNQTLPDVSLHVDYGLTGLGGTQFLRGAGFPGPIVGETGRSFFSVLGDVFTNEFPSWTGALSVSYPLGRTPEQAGLARSRAQYTRSQTDLRNQQLQVQREVREAGRQVVTNERRIQTTRAARQAAERRLEAEERKLAAGTSTSFLVFQAQRDLSQARSNELRAVLDYNRSVTDFETVQDAPIGQ